MQFIIIVILSTFMIIEKVICWTLDVLYENRIIHPMTGVVLTLLVSSLYLSLDRVKTQPAHIVHILLYVACLVYIRVMLHFIFSFFFLPLL